MATAPVSVTQLVNASLDADDLGVFVNGSVSDTAVNRAGRLLRTLAYYEAAFEQALADAGYLPSVPYTAGIVLNDPRQTVEYNGAVYAPLSSALPFTTSGTFETAKFKVVQGATLDQVNALLEARNVARGQVAEGIANYLDVLPEPAVTANAALRSAIANNAATVVGMGHSIMEGADIPAANHFFTTMASMFSTKFPGVAWNFQNRGLAGKTSSQLVSSSFIGGSTDSGNNYFRPANTNPEVWPDGSTLGRSYLEEIRLLAPDVLLVYMWQNNSGNVAVSVADTMTLISTVSAWAKVPQIVLCTEYLPASTPPDQFGADAATQNGIQAIADAIRSLALKLGVFLIDFNAIYRLERDGVKVEHARFWREASFVNFDGGSSGINWLSAGVTVVGSNATFGAGGGTMIRKVKARDVEQKGTFAYLNPSDVIKVSWGRTTPENENQGSVLQLRPSGTDTLLDLYAQGTLISTTTLPYTHGAGGKVAFLHRVTSGRSVLHLSMNDGEWQDPIVLNLPDTAAATGFYPGAFGTTVYSATNTAGQILFGYEANYTPADVLAKTNAVMPELFSQVDLMGAVPYGDMNTNPLSLGGNAINHVGSIGSHLYMIPAVARFVRHFGRVWDLVKAVSAGTSPEEPVEFTSEMKLVNLSNGVLSSFSPVQNFALYSVKRGRLVYVSGVYGSGANFTVPDGFGLCFTLPYQSAFTDGSRLVVQSLYASQANGLIPVAAAGSEVIGMVTVRVPGSTSYATIQTLSVPTGTTKQIASVNSGALVAVAGSYISS